jgi:hypothetical protein
MPPMRTFHLPTTVTHCWTFTFYIYNTRAWGQEHVQVGVKAIVGWRQHWPDYSEAQGRSWLNFGLSDHYYICADYG